MPHGSTLNLSVLFVLNLYLFGLWTGADLLTGPDEMMLTGQIKDAQFDVPTTLNNTLSIILCADK